MIKKSKKNSKSALNLNQLFLVILWSVFCEELSQLNFKAGNFIWKKKWVNKILKLKIFRINCLIAMFVNRNLPKIIYSSWFSKRTHKNHSWRSQRFQIWLVENYFLMLVIWEDTSKLFMKVIKISNLNLVKNHLLKVIL